jgi:glutamine amidotransferase-like uncharacterized protein
MASGIDPEFKPQYCKKEKENKLFHAEVLKIGAMWLNHF